MLSLKLFIEAVHDAIIHANDQLFEKGEGLLDRFFAPDKVDPKKLIAKTVAIEYPHLDAKGNIEPQMVNVPLITLVPLAPTQIEKATFSIQFEIEEADNELQISFKKRSTGGWFGKKTEPKYGNLEISITPQDTPEGVKVMVEAYERVLKQQLF